MRGKSNPELKARCLQLRDEARHSLREIHAITGVPKGTLSGWLSGHPLTKKEIQVRKEQVVRIKKPLPGPTPEELPAWFSAAAPWDLSSQQKARVAEAAVLLRLVAHGHAVYGSVFDGDIADWIVELAPTRTLVKVQVRSTMQASSGLPCVSLSRTVGHSGKRKFAPNEFDYIVGYCFRNDTCYIWTYAEVAHLRSAVAVCGTAVEAWTKLRP